MIGRPGEDYELLDVNRVHVGDVVIVEHLRWDYKKGYQVDSVYYRAVIGRHNTVAGPMWHMTNEPDAEFPAFAPWQGHPYAENNGNTRLWRKI